MSYSYAQSEVTSSNPDTVLSKTFGLIGLSMIPTVLMAYLVAQIPIEFYQMHGVAVLVGFVVLFLVSLGFMFFAMSQRTEALAVTGMMLFAGCMGAIMGPTIMITLHKSNGMQLILGAASLTGISLFGLTAYALKTKRDFSFMGGFLFASLLVLIGGGILQMFFHSPLLNMILTVAGVLVFLAYILYDVSRVVTGGEQNYVFAAIAIYLDILNLFLDLLRLLSMLSGDDD